MRKHIFLGFVIVLLFMMMPVSTVFATIASPPAITDHGNFSAVIAEASATIVHPSELIMDAAAGTITVNLVNSTGAIITSTGIGSPVIKIDAGQIITDLDIASIANMNTGKNVDGATKVITRNTDAANNGTSTSIFALVSPVTSNNSDWIQISNGATNGAMNGVYFYPVEATFVLKIMIPADANLAINTPTAILSTDNAGNTNATIDYSIQSGQKVRTLVKANENQAATYRTDGAAISATEQIAKPDLAMNSAAAIISFKSKGKTDQVQNQEGNTAYANDLAGVVSEDAIHLVDAIADTDRAPTTYTEGTFAYDIAAAGLVALNFA